MQSSKADQWFETTLNYWMLVERYPNLKEEVGGSIPGCEISSLLDKKLVRWSIVSCALAAVRLPIKKKKEKRKKKKKKKLINVVRLNNKFRSEGYSMWQACVSFCLRLFQLEHA